MELFHTFLTAKPKRRCTLQSPQVQVEEDLNQKVGKKPAQRNADGGSHQEVEPGHGQGGGVEEDHLGGGSGKEDKHMAYHKK